MIRTLLATILLLCASPVLAADPRIIIAKIAKPEKNIFFELELAATPAAREQGLMHRKTIGVFDGMVFFFPKPSTQKFWMKDTPLPLDILFVDEAGSIVYIAHGKPLSEEPVGPDTPVATVIELMGGRAKQSGITVGDKVTYDIQGRPSAMAH